MLNGSNKNLNSTHFVDPDDGNHIQNGMEADFLNSYLCNISIRLGVHSDDRLDPEINNDLYKMYGNVELEHFVSGVDVSKS